MIYLIQLQLASSQLTKHLNYGEDDDQKLSSDIFGPFCAMLPRVTPFHPL